MAAAYTLKKLTDVKDSAPAFGHGEVQEARFAGGDLDATDTGVSHQRIKPNQRVPFAQSVGPPPLDDLALLFGV